MKQSNINLSIEQFKNNLYHTINNSGLPLSVVFYVFKFIERDLENTYYEILKKEKQNNAEQSNLSLDEKD